MAVPGAQRRGFRRVGPVAVIVHHTASGPRGDGRARRAPPDERERCQADGEPVRGPRWPLVGVRGGGDEHERQGRAARAAPGELGEQPRDRDRGRQQRHRRALARRHAGQLRDGRCRPRRGVRHRPGARLRPSRVGAEPEDRPSGAEPLRLGQPPRVVGHGSLPGGGCHAPRWARRWLWSPTPRRRCPWRRGPPRPSCSPATRGGRSPGRCSAIRGRRGRRSPQPTEAPIVCCTPATCWPSRGHRPPPGVGPIPAPDPAPAPDPVPAPAPSRAPAGGGIPPFPGEARQGHRGPVVDAWQRALIVAGVISDQPANRDGRYARAWRER